VYQGDNHIVARHVIGSRRGRGRATVSMVTPEWLASRYRTSDGVAPAVS